MKYMKKLSALLLALIMVLSLTVGASAAMEGTLTDGTITINDAVPGQTYSAYQILYLESYNPDTDPDTEGDQGAYAYKANSVWEPWLRTQTSYVSFDAQGYVTWVADADPAAFAKAAQSYAKQNNISADKTANAPVAAEGATHSVVTLSELKLGYYLVDTTLGTLCSLDTTNPNVVMEEKNEAPTVTKEVQEDSNSAWGETNDADINQTVNYKATITVQTGAENYILHDTMSAGLTFNANSVVVKNGTTTLTAGTEYTLITTGLADSCTFEVKFDNTYIASLAAGTQIVVEYSATVNSNAVVGLPGNPNEIKLQYGDENSPSYTPVDKTTTYTWDMEVLKYANGNESNVLAGVKFVLLNSDKSKVATVENGKLTGWDNVPTADADGTITWPANTTLTTDADGKISVDGLDADTYYLREIEALPGYNKLADDVTVTVTAASADTEDTTELVYNTTVTKVNNQSGTELPSTGGMGTTLFYIVGGVLVLAAVVLLVTKKRMASAE